MNIRITLISALILLLSSGNLFAGDALLQGGDVVKEERSVSTFDALKVSGAFHVKLVQGSSEALTLECDAEHIQDVVTEVKGETLHIYLEGAWKNTNTKTMNIYLTFRQLESIDLSGAVSLEAKDKLKFNDLEIEVSGAAGLNIPLVAERLSGDISGAADIELFGKAGSVELEISGASSFKADELEVENMSMEVSGASSVKVFVTGRLEAEVSGASSVRYKGDPKVEVERTGAGSFEKM